MSALALLWAAATGCKPDRAAPQSVAVAYTSVDQVFAEPVYRACEARRGLTIQALFDTEETKSTGVLSRLLAEAEHPQADVFWSGDPMRPFVLIERGLVQPYRSPSAAGLPAAFRASDDTWTGFAARARVLLVNTHVVGASDLPRSVRDLAAERWKGKTALANPLFGTTTMHVAALAAAWGEPELRAFFDRLKAGGVRVAASNGEVQRLVVSGEVAFGLTDTDDAAEAVASGAPVRVVYPDQDGAGTLVMPSVVVLMAHGPHPEAGQRLIDCLLEAPVEERLAAAGAHMPLRAGVPTPKGVTPLSAVKAMPVDYAHLASTIQRLEPWLRHWVGL